MLYLASTILESANDNAIDINDIQLPKIKISEKKTQTILEEGGMLDAYKYLIKISKIYLDLVNNDIEYHSH